MTVTALKSRLKACARLRRLRLKRLWLGRHGNRSLCSRQLLSSSVSISHPRHSPTRTIVISSLSLHVVGVGPGHACTSRGVLGIAEHVRMPGRVDHPTVIKTLRRCDVSVLPSRFEGLGMAALEAMQYGVPTITADFEASYDFLEDGVTAVEWAEPLAGLSPTDYLDVVLVIPGEQERDITFTGHGPRGEELISSLS